MAQSNAIGVVLIEQINLRRLRADKWALKWTDSWFTIAFRLATEHALGVDVSTRSNQAKTIREMGKAMSFIDFTINLAIVDGYSKKALDDALSQFVANQKKRLTHSAVAAFQKGKNVFFAQISGRFVDTEISTPF